MLKGVIICAFVLVLPQVFSTRFDLSDDVQNSLKNHQGLYHRHHKRAPTHEEEKKHKKAPKLYIVNKHLEQEVREGFLNRPPPPSKPLRFIVTPPPPNVTTTAKPPAQQPAAPVTLDIAQNGAKISLQLVDVGDNKKKQMPQMKKIQATTATPKKPSSKKPTAEDNSQSEDYDLNDDSFSEDDGENDIDSGEENLDDESDNRKSDSYSESYFRIWV